MKGSTVHRSIAWAVMLAGIATLLLSGCKNQKTDSSNNGGQSVAEPARRDIWAGLWLFTTTAVYPEMPQFSPQELQSRTTENTMGYISMAEGLMQLDIRADQTASLRMGEGQTDFSWKSDANTITLTPTQRQPAGQGPHRTSSLTFSQVTDDLMRVVPTGDVNSTESKLQAMGGFRRFSQPTGLSISDLQGEWQLDQAATRRRGVETLIAALDASVARGAADDMKLREDLIKQRSESFTPSPRLDSIVIIKDNQLSIASPNAKTRETRQVAISQRADGIFTMELPSREPNAGLMAPLLIQGDALILGPGTPTAMVYRRR